MNLHIIGVVIRREYFNKVRKKSFLLITFLVPVLFALLCILPTAIMLGAKEETKKIAVVDRSGIVLPYLTDTETTKFENFTSIGADSTKAILSDLGMDALLSISALDPQTRSVKAESFSFKPLGVDMTESINGKITKAVEDWRIGTYDIKDLDKIMKEVKCNVSMTSYTLGEDGSEVLSVSGIYMVVSMMLGMVIYLFITLFSSMVMSSVIEEKSSRVVEVLVSSVKSTELMFGKIVGVALVAATQFLLWIVLSGVLLSVAGGIMGQDLLSGADPQAMTATLGGSDPLSGTLGTDPVAALGMEEASGLQVALSTLKNLPWLSMALSFVFFFFFGYLLYASLFAAIGSAVENEADTNQLQLPLTIPLLLGFLISFATYKAPDSALVFWGSMIPFTSPIVMLARIPFGVPLWQLLLSGALLAGTFVLCAWLSAKIYRVGILMFGKKSSFKDLWKWLKMK